MLKLLKSLWSRKRVITVKVTPVAAPWTKEDAECLNKFLGSNAGRKLVALLEFTLYQKVLDPSPLTKVRQGIILGWSIFIDTLKYSSNFEDFLTQAEIDERDDDIEDDDEHEGNAN